MKHLEPAVATQRRELEKLQTVLPKLQQSVDGLQSLVIDKAFVETSVMQTQYQVALDKLLKYEAKAKAC